MIHLTQFIRSITAMFSTAGYPNRPGDILARVKQKPFRFNWKPLLPLVTGSFLLSGCTYDVEKELGGTTPGCDTASISYANVVVPILNNNGCITCHGAGAPSGNVVLSTFAGVRARALDGKLLGSISHAPGFSPMPQGGPKLSNCEISKIRSWIDAGAPQN